MEGTVHIFNSASKYSSTSEIYQNFYAYTGELDHVALVQPKHKPTTLYRIFSWLKRARFF